jgi:hypothetical protein
VALELSSDDVSLARLASPYLQELVVSSTWDSIEIDLEPVGELRALRSFASDKVRLRNLAALHNTTCTQLRLHRAVTSFDFNAIEPRWTVDSLDLSEVIGLEDLLRLAPIAGLRTCAWQIAASCPG